MFNVAPLARISSEILIATGRLFCLLSLVRSVPSSSLALLSDDPSREPFVGGQVAAVLPKSNSRSDFGPGCSVARSRKWLATRDWS